MARYTTVGEMAAGAQVSATSLALFITQNFDHEKREAASIEGRIAVLEDRAPDILEAFRKGTPAAVAAAKAKWANERMAELVANMPHTSTPSFEGYRITRYGGFATGTSTINTVGGFFGTKTDVVEASINAARIEAIHNLKQKAFDMDCNAVVGLDVDFVSVDSHGSFNAQADSHYIMVCANGTAVEIEPLSELGE